MLQRCNGCVQSKKCELEWECECGRVNNSHFFRLQPSIFYRGYLIFTYVFALISVGLVMQKWVFFFFVFSTLGPFGYYFFHHEKIMAFRYDKKTEWILHCVDNSVERVVLLPSSVMMSYFLLLHFKGFSDGRKKIIVLFSDSFSRDDFRSLRRCVRMGFL